MQRHYKFIILKQKTRRKFLEKTRSEVFTVTSKELVLQTLEFRNTEGRVPASSGLFHGQMTITGYAAHVAP